METRKRTKSRLMWLSVLLVLLAVSVGGYFWYEQTTIKYDRITNAKRV